MGVAYNKRCGFGVGLPVPKTSLGQTAQFIALSIVLSNKLAVATKVRAGISE